LITLAILAFLSIVSGLGWGWVANLETPGTVRSWLAPTTAIGLGLSGLLHSVGWHVSTTAVLSGARVFGFTVAGAGAVYLLKISDRIGGLKALAISLLLFVVLGPVVQDWYLTWGLLLLAPVATGRWRTLIIGVSVLSPFLGLPGGRTLIDQLIHSDPLSVALAFVVLLGVLLVPLGRWSGTWRWHAALDGSDSWGDAMLEPSSPRVELLEHPLEFDDVEPPAVFPSHLSLHADHLEPAREMQVGRRVFEPSVRAMIVWNPCSEPRRMSSSNRARPTPPRRAPRAT